MKELNFNIESLDDFLGQKEIIDQLKISIFSAKKRETVLDHILFYGPSGLGKTTLANIISNEMNAKIIKIYAPSIEKITDLISIISQIEENNILFIDEIHQLEQNIEEILYEVMDNNTLTIVYKNNDITKNIKLEIPRFTLIGATTDAGKISIPLRNRFTSIFKLQYYTKEELSLIIVNNLKKINLIVEFKAIEEISYRSRNTPRNSNLILKRLYDYSLFKNLSFITYQDIIEFFNFIKIYKYGLTYEDLLILKIMYEDYKNIPISMKTLAITINENENNLLKINEPYLVFIGFIKRTKKGRILSTKAIEFYNEYKSGMVI